MVTIGIPKAMFFYEDSSIWEEFFKSLGFEVVLSQDTNRKILDEGIRCCNNETCLPVKVFHGHVMSLKDKVDYVFIPRYQRTCKNEYTCPKVCGLPDMAAANLAGQIRIIEVKINMDSYSYDTKESLLNIAKTFKIKPYKVLDAFNTAWTRYTQIKFKENRIRKIEGDGNKAGLVVLGHPYMVYDNYISMGLIEKLKKRNIDVYTSGDIDFETKRRNAYPYQGKIFWDIGFELLGSAFTYARDENVKGMIYLTPFGCGLDAFIMEFIELGIKSSEIPLLKLTVDEHTGEVGFDTRLEAFIDMIG